MIIKNIKFSLFYRINATNDDAQNERKQNTPPKTTGHSSIRVHYTHHIRGFCMMRIINDKR